MKSTVSQEGPTKVRVSVEATPEEIAPSVDRAFRKLANDVKVPGFRKGKVPRKVLEARLGPDQIKDATIREAVPELFRQAMSESDVSPLTLPEIEVTSYEEGGPLSFEAVVEVRPDDTVESLGARVLEREHTFLVETLQRIVAGGVVTAR